MKIRWTWLRFFFVATFASTFLVYELATSGRLESPFVHDRLYPTLQRLSAPFTDLKFRLRRSGKPKNSIVMVEIDSEAIAEVGRWPWRRDVIAYLIEKTFALGATIVAVDIVFSEPEELVPVELVQNLERRGLARLVGSFETDPILEGAIRRHADKLVLSWMTEFACRPLFTPIRCPEAPPRTPVLSAVTTVPNIRRFNEAAPHQGFVNVSRDPDGVIRKANLIMMANRKALPAFSLEIARLALNEELEVALDADRGLKRLRFARSGRDIATTRTGLVGVNFRGGRRTFPHLSASRVLNAAEGGNGNDGTEILKGAIVLIGVSALGLQDVAATPVDETMSGIELHANLVDNLLSGDSLVDSTAENRAFLAVAVLLALMVVGVSLLAWIANRLVAWKALSILFGAALLILLVDTKLLFTLNRNWSTGFLYLELASVIVCTIAEKYLVEERRKLRAEGELKTAQLVQSTLLAPPILETDRVSVAAHYVSASECGGDIWDARLHGHRMTTWIGDATGHGVSAAIVTAVVKSAFTTLGATHSEALPSPDECLSILNRIVHSNCKGKMLMTVCLLQLDIETGELVLASAGHESPLLRQGNAVETLFARGERLGFDSHSKYRLERFQLEPGDSLLLYTDGVYGAQDCKGKEWGERRVKKRFGTCPKGDATSIRDYMVSGLAEHTRGRAQGQSDDIMLVVLQWNPKTVSQVPEGSADRDASF